MDAELAGGDRRRIARRRGKKKAIVAVGFVYAKSIGTVAKKYPNVKFAIIDDASPDSKGTNVEQITFTPELIVRGSSAA